MTTNRINRIPIEAGSVLSSSEYTIIDYILYRSNLDGWKLHANDIAKNMNLSERQVRTILKRLPFITKRGTSRDSEYLFNLETFVTYIQEKISGIEGQNITQHSGKNFRNERHKFPESVTQISGIESVKFPESFRKILPDTNISNKKQIKQIKHTEQAKAPFQPKTKTKIMNLESEHLMNNQINESTEGANKIDTFQATAGAVQSETKLNANNDTLQATAGAEKHKLNLTALNTFITRNRERRPGLYSAFRKACSMWRERHDEQTCYILAEYGANRLLDMLEDKILNESNYPTHLKFGQKNSCFTKVIERECKDKHLIE